MNNIPENSIYKHPSQKNIEPMWVLRCKENYSINDITMNLLDDVFNPDQYFEGELLSELHNIREEKLKKWYPWRNSRLTDISINKDWTINFQMQEIEYWRNAALWWDYIITQKIIDQKWIEYISKGLWVAICIQTSDNKYVIGVKPKWSIIPYDFIWWIVEFNQNFKDLVYKEIIKNKPEKKVNFLRMTILKELKEEIWIQNKEIEWEIDLLWCVLWWLWRYILVTKIHVTISSNDIIKRFEWNNCKEFEEIICLDKIDLKDLLANQSKIKQLIGESI